MLNLVLLCYAVKLGVSFAFNQIMWRENALLSTNVINVKIAITYRFEIKVFKRPQTRTVVQIKNQFCFKPAEYVFHSEEPGGSGLVRVLFDGGSQRSYVTGYLAEKLNLSVIRREKLAISSFRAADSVMKDMNVVRLRIKCLNNMGFVCMEVLVTPIICSPLSNQRPKQARLAFKHLENLYLSDYADSDDKNIDVLIGTDFYFSFISGKYIRGTVPNSPVALESWLDSYGSFRRWINYVFTVCRKIKYS